ncbi:hypothetical protein CMO96_03840 [Candidatus Woesebacteria bacterium]|nr:hypothetical protein [Candidatus Woesebacteria bacterium]
MKGPSLTPQVAQKLVATFREFEQTKDLAIDGLSHTSFLLLIENLGDYLGTEEAGETIELLEKIARGEVDPDEIGESPDALNVEAGVEQYDRWEEMRQEMPKNPTRLQVQAAVVTAPLRKKETVAEETPEDVPPEPKETRATPPPPLPTFRVGNSANTPTPPTGISPTAPGFVKKQATSFSKNISSSASIRLRQLFTNPKLGWLRTSLAVVGMGSALALPIPGFARAVLFVSGAGIGLSQVRFSPRIASWPIDLLTKARGGASVRHTGIPRVGGGSSFSGIRLGGPAKWITALPLILIGGVVAIIFLTQHNINTAQKTFLPEVGAALFESPYIALSKTTPSQQEFENGQLPDQITYTISVSPKEGKLSDVSVRDVTHANGKNIDRDIDEQNWKVPEITTEWTQPVTLVIPGGIKGGLDDSLIINTVIIRATIEGVEEPQSVNTSVVIRVGSPPEDCPSGWPTATGWVNQGPDGPATHQNTEAMDIHGNAIGTQIFAAHKGTAYFFKDRYGGHDVQVFGSCNGETFSSFYVHLNPASSPISPNGEEIKKGDFVGDVGCTGWCTSPHLHYQFKGLKMAPPYIPKSVPRGCVGRESCGVDL